MINITIKTRTQELINLIRYYISLILRKTKFFEYETLPVPKRLSVVIVSSIVISYCYQFRIFAKTQIKTKCHDR